VLRGGAPRFCTRSMPESHLEAAKLEMHSSPKKSRGETEKEVLSGWRGRGDGRDPCNCCMSQSLDQEELSRLSTPATGIVVMYNERLEELNQHA
jgi:hypothetical protein